MYVCMCYGITDKAIRSAVEEGGVGNMRELRQQLDVGSQCGKCIQMAQQIIDTTIIDETLFRDVG
ncbi:bacterioferritin-associated ferredoxin [Alteromonas sp. ASW11-19]|uniref:Bacterioferritin-associated ferredoxin n=1 Tax=Alteromonas salexigens TaxID=2982530 RepID=A0ABT2VPX8_9ALTE|nr:bacterioferritin-associated ferredoxin [Alteromonas salexigens]MCU7555129.1 bacterioferritin-associated ferredoxin [Alteromonas salexigens]